MEYESGQWAAVLEVGQQNLLLGQLGVQVTSKVTLEQLPQAVQRHLALASLTSRRRIEAALWEVGVIRSAIPGTIPIVLLKGIAYAAAKDENARGRLFTDIDILVPRQFIEEAETGLFTQGWQPGKVDDYDRKYYREWMHELPPMTHVRRQTVVDLHHAIVPVISKFSFPADLLLQDAVEIAPNVYVLSPTDRIIHCAIHALIEGESTKILRELYDLFLLLGQHAPSSLQVSHVLGRARQLGIEQLVGPPIEAAKQVFSSDTLHSDGMVKQWLIDVATVGAADSSLRTRLARIGLLSYSHWIKMPMHRLIPHLIRKSIKEYFPPREA